MSNADRKMLAVKVGATYLPAIVEHKNLPMLEGGHCSSIGV
jgi:hypothetical protein